MPSTAKIPPQIRKNIPSDQHLITIVKRHIIGLVYIYLIIAAAVAALVVSLGAASPNLLEGLSGKEFTMLSAASVLVVALVTFILILVTNIYYNNALVITDKETVQVLQRGVFHVKVSHLSHADIEDVTSERSGLLPTIFGYGTLHIETSGEFKNFAFSYCPNPEHYAGIVLEARQKFTESSGS